MLQEVSGEILPSSSIITNEAHLDVAARGFWVKGQMAYFDVKVFNPTAKTYLNQSLKAAHRSNEQMKKRSYNTRINLIDQGTFTPLVFTCFGGMSRECSTFYSRLAEMLAEKRSIHASKMKSWIRTKLSFCLLRSQITCLRGSRSIIRNNTPFQDTDVNLVLEESRIADK